MSGLPPGWAEATLGDVAATQLGKMLSQKASAGVSPYPYLRNKNVQWGRFDLADIAEMDFTQDELTRFEVRQGDLLVCEGGEVGRAAIWQGQIAPIGFQKALHRLRPYAGIEQQLLLYQLMWLAQTSALDPFVTGSTIKHLPQEDLRTLPIFVPPLGEQRRIVGAIEEQFSRLDAAEVILARAHRQASALARVVLIGVTREVPPHWRPTSIGEVGRVQLGRQRAPKHHSGPNMRPYLRVANVFEDRIDLRDVKTMDFSDTEAKRYRLEVGDILLNEGQTPQLVGRAAMYRGELPGVCFTNSLIRFQACSQVDPAFALLVFRSHLHSGRFRREARITTNIAHMAANRFKAVEFPLAPLSEQQEVVAEVERQLSVIDAIRASIAVARRRGAALRRSILVQAFRGLLVPQDPTDEPATGLLDRMRAERVNQLPRRRSRSRAGSTPPA